MNAMFGAAGAARLAELADRLGVKPLLGELDEDQVGDDERAEHGKELPRQRREAEGVRQRRNREHDADSNHGETGDGQRPRPRAIHGFLIITRPGLSSEDSDKLVRIRARHEPEKAQAIPANR